MDDKIQLDVVERLAIQALSQRRQELERDVAECLRALETRYGLVPESIGKDYQVMGTEIIRQNAPLNSDSDGDALRS